MTATSAPAPSPGPGQGTLAARVAALTWRDWVGIGALAAPLLAAMVLAFRSGGHFLSDWGIASACLLICAAVAAVVLREMGGWWGAAAVGGWVALAAWQGASMAWADDPAAARDAMNLTMLYAAALALGLLGTRRPEWLGRVSEACLALAAIVTAAGEAARLFPGAIGEDTVARLSWPIGYWNAQGMLAAFGLVLAVAIGADGRRPIALRGVACGLVPLFTLAIVLTLSRGALVVAVIGLLALVLLAPGRLETIACALGTLVVAAPLALYVNGVDELVALKGELPPHADEGRRVALLLVIAMVAAAGVGLAARLGAARIPDRAQRLTLIGILCAVVVVALGSLIAAPPPGGPVGWADDQFESFRSYAPGKRGQTGSISDRLAVAAGSGRWQQWEVAADQWRSAPLVGTGAGEYPLEWAEERPIEQSVVNAHSLYLEVLAESGLIGLVLLLVPVGAGVAVAVIRMRGTPRPLRREIAAAGAAVLVVALHMAGDWDWQIPAVVLPAVVLGGSAIRAAATPAAPSSRVSWSLLAAPVVAALALVAVLLVVPSTLAARDLADARAAARAGDLAAAEAKARDAVARDPMSPDARLMLANVLSDEGRGQAADVVYAEALARSPRDWVILADWATSLALRGRERDATVLLAGARRANPLEPRLDALEETIAEGG